MYSTFLLSISVYYCTFYSSLHFCVEIPLLVVQAKCDNWRKHVSTVETSLHRTSNSTSMHGIGMALLWRVLGVWLRLAADWHLASRNCWHQAWFHTSVGSIGSVHRPPGCPGQRWPARSVDEGPDWTTENSYDGIPHTRIPTTENDKMTEFPIWNWELRFSSPLHPANDLAQFTKHADWYMLQVDTYAPQLDICVPNYIYYISESGLSWHMHLHGSGHRHITAWAASYLTYRPALQSSSMLVKAVQFWSILQIATLSKLFFSPHSATNVPGMTLTGLPTSMGRTAFAIKAYPKFIIIHPHPVSNCIEFFGKHLPGMSR